MDVNKEIFIYLGQQKSNANLMLMQHLQFNEMSKEQLANICIQVYIAMIKDGLIYSKGSPETIPYLLIYNIMKDGNILPVIVNHVSSPTIQFPEGTVNELIYEAFKAPRSPNQPTVVVAVQVKDGIPLLMDVFDIPIPEDCQKAMKQLEVSSMTFESLERGICTKDIPQR